MLFKFINRILLVASACVLFCAGCASVQDSGYDHNSAAQGFQNEPVDQSVSKERLGMDYLLGRGVPENRELAFSWFEKAAAQGSAKAANELGYMYASGKGVAQNYQLALEYYQQAADGGIASAKYNLGLLYLNGLGTPADPARAQADFQEAAAMGFGPARKKMTG